MTDPLEVRGRRAARPPATRTVGVAGLLLLAVVGVAWIVRVDGAGPIDAGRNGSPVVEAGAGSDWEAVGGDAFHSPEGLVRVTDVAVADGTVVAVGGHAENGPDGMAGAAVWRSAEGREWQRVAADSIDDGDDRFNQPASAMEGVAVVGHDGGSRLVAVGWAQDEQDRVPLAWVSDDLGGTWRLVQPEAVGGRLEAVTASPAGLVGVGAVERSRGVSGASWFSNDGERWERRAVSGLGDTDVLHSVAVAGGTSVAAAIVPGDEPVLWTSDDGLAWQPAQLPEGADGRVGVARVAAAGDGGFLAAWSVLPPGQGDTDGFVLRSSDGRVWSQAAKPGGNIPGDGDQRVHDIAHDDTGVVVVGVDDGDPVVWHAPHGRGWEAVARGDHGLAGAGPDATAAMTRIDRIPGGLLAIGSVTDTSDRAERPVMWLHPTEEQTADRTPPPDPIGVRLVASGDTRLAIADVDAATTESFDLEELSGGDPPFRLARRDDAIVFFGNGGDVYVVDPDRPDDPRELGSATYFLPSADDDRVWLVEGNTSPDAHLRVREVTVDGDETVVPTDVSPGTSPLAAVSAGIVLTGDSGLEVWDPEADDVVARLAGGRLVAAGRTLLGWCRPPCSELRLTGIGGGDGTALPDGLDERLVDAPDDAGEWVPRGGAFAPDGRHLAVPITAAPDPFAEPDADFGLAIVDVGSGDVRVLEEASVPPGPFAWSPDGRWLFAPTSGGGTLVHDVESHRTEVRVFDLGTIHGLAAVE